MKKYLPFFMMLLIVAVSAYIFNCCSEPETVDEINADSTRSYSVYSKLVVENAQGFLEEARLNDAINILQHAYDVAPNRPNHKPEDFIEVAVLLGKAYTTKAFLTNNGSEKAVSVLTEAVNAADTLGNEKLLADALHHKGRALYTRSFLTGKDDYKEALNLVGRAMSMRSSSGDKKGEAESLIFYGLLNEKMGNKDNAFELYHRALVIAEENELPKIEAMALRHIAFMLRAKGEKFNRSAMDYFRRSLALREREGVKDFLPFSYISVGDMHFAENRIDSALYYYNKAEKLAHDNKSKRVIVLTQWLKGDMAWARLDTAKAKEHYTSALHTADEIGYNYAADSLSALLEGLKQEK